MRDEWKLKGGWFVKPKLEGDKEFAKYVHRIAEAKKLANPDVYNRPKPVKPEGMSQDDWILSMQAASTKEIIAKQKDPDYKRDWTAPLPDNVLANPNAKTKEELVGERPYDLSAWSHFESIRSWPRNSLGQSEKKSVSDSSIESAKHHFMVSPPALLTEDEIEGVKDLIAPPKGRPATAPPPQEWREVGVWEALINFCKRKPVRYRK